MADGRAFVTGALGFIGRAISDRLRQDGWKVTGLDVQADEELGVIAADISVPGGWQYALANCDLVVHTAAVVSNAVDFDRQWEVNVLGTRHVLDASVAGGAGRFVLFSSVRAFGDSGFPENVTEEHPPRPDGSAYVNTKIAAEQVALQAHAAGEIDVTVVRPGDVYGPGSRPWVILPLEAIQSGQFLLPAGGKGMFSPIYIDDLLDGVMLASTLPQGVGQVFTLTDGEPVSTAEYFGHLARMAGKGKLRSAPTGVLVAATAVAEKAARVRGRGTEINPETMRYLSRDAGYSNAKARKMLDFDPKVSLAEGMGRTETWLRESGLIG